jgi:predicted transcriptional regulator
VDIGAGDLTVELTDDELEALREVAEREGRSLQDVGRTALREYVSRRHRAAVETSTAAVVEQYGEALRRLGEM